MDRHVVVLIGEAGPDQVVMRVGVAADSEDEAHRKAWALLSPGTQRQMRIVTDVLEGGRLATTRREPQPHLVLF